MCECVHVLVFMSVCCVFVCLCFMCVYVLGVFCVYMRACFQWMCVWVLCVFYFREYVFYVQNSRLQSSPDFQGFFQLFAPFFLYLTLQFTLSGTPYHIFRIYIYFKIHYVIVVTWSRKQTCKYLRFKLILETLQHGVYLRINWDISKFYFKFMTVKSVLSLYFFIPLYEFI